MVLRIRQLTKDQYNCHDKIDWPFAFTVSDDQDFEHWISDLVTTFGHVNQSRWRFSYNALCGFSFNRGWLGKYARSEWQTIGQNWITGMVVRFKNEEDAMLFKLMFG